MCRQMIAVMSSGQGNNGYAQTIQFKTNDAPLSTEAIATILDVIRFLVINIQ